MEIVWPCVITALVLAVSGRSKNFIMEKDYSCKQKWKDILLGHKLRSLCQYWKWMTCEKDILQTVILIPDCIRNTWVYDKNTNSLASNQTYYVQNLQCHTIICDNYVFLWGLNEKSLKMLIMVPCI